MIDDVLVCCESGIVVVFLSSIDVFEDFLWMTSFSFDAPKLIVAADC